jgi:RimJ/RimL family protein N-acetyltransferase
MIKLETLYLEKLEINGKHYGLVESMSLDKKIKMYIARDFLVWLEQHQAILDNEIEVGKMYAVIKDGREIGIVGSTGNMEDGILNVIYAIKKDARDRGNGYKLLKEITTYYLNNIDGIKDIKLVIDKSNKASYKLAEKEGYVKYKENESGLEEWYYRKRKIKENN